MLASWLFAILLVAAAFHAAIADSNPSPKPYDECDKPNDEFFYLVHQWPPGYCLTEHCGNQPPNRFTIHGFWPNYCKDRAGKDWPEFCSGDNFDEDVISDLIPTMEQEWPSLSGGASDEFWQHEWEKHGTCALAYTPFGLNSQREYFETVLELHKANDLYRTLASHGITPGGLYSVEEIEAAVVAELGGDAYLHCQGRDNVLVEIYICYNQRLARVPCSRQGVCKDQVKFALPRSDELLAS